ncbi:hypothetical protein F5J12DRAFT_888766 [Pisolithus orientalis]|uniref:uncharacterized protein n=1 Tax=Pisolithus orientalis TaxID=936130 RepID=UPI00222447EB|nr:uncharacterized protein F5J12DRAFT_888766 [Pisolithus orientalis]KAI6030957.1 hypothetical protein F5J12DRAFT_888766 [Pisolithus orientalis]
MSATPSAVLTDALAAFGRAATLAITTAQEQATAETREARRERDEAIKALHDCKLEEQAWKEEANTWKAAARQAELTIEHHLDTIAQLRQEATQWKEQCLRLEDNSRVEAVSWKEQFLRVEQERSRLAQRVDVLVSERLSVRSSPFFCNLRSKSTFTVRRLQAKPQSLDPTAHVTPIMRHSDAKDLSASTSASVKPKAPSSALQTRQPPGSLPTPTSENRANARLTAGQATHFRGPSGGAGVPDRRPLLLRRVQAVVEVPVKEESVDRDVRKGIAPSASTSASASTSKFAPVQTPATKANQGVTRIKRKSAPQRLYVEVDESGTPSDDMETDAGSDDDELMMGAEPNLEEISGIKHIRKPPASAKKPSTQPLKAKKRKIVPAAENNARPRK